MILVAGGKVLPEIGVLLGRRSEPMQVDHDVRAPVGGEHDRLVDRRPILGAAVLLIRTLAVPERVVHRQPHAVGFPVVDRHDHRLERLLVVRQRFEATGVHALQPDFVPFRVAQTVADDFDFRRPLRAVRLFGRHKTEPLFLLTLPRGGQQRFGRCRLQHQVVEIERSRLDLKQRRHQGHGKGLVRHEKLEALGDPAVGVFLRVGRRRLGDLLAIDAVQFEQDPGVEPGCGTFLQSRDPLPPREFERLGARRDVDDPIDHHHFARLGRNEAQEAVAFFTWPLARLRTPPGRRPAGLLLVLGLEIAIRQERSLFGKQLCRLRASLLGFGLQFGLTLRRGDALGFDQWSGVDRSQGDVVEVERSGFHLEQARHELERLCARGNEERGRLLGPAVGIFARRDRFGRWCDLLAIGVEKLEQQAGIEPRLLADLQPAHALPPGQFERLGPGRNLELLIEHHQLARRRRLQPQEAIVLVGQPASAVELRPTIGPLIVVGVALEIAVGNQLFPHRWDRLPQDESENRQNRDHTEPTHDEPVSHQTEREQPRPEWPRLLRRAPC